MNERKAMRESIGWEINNIGETEPCTWLCIESLPACRAYNEEISWRVDGGPQSGGGGGEWVDEEDLAWGGVKLWGRRVKIVREWRVHGRVS